MTRSTVPTPPSPDRAPVHVVHVLGGTSSGLGHQPPSALTCAHLRLLAHGLAARGVRVTVHAPAEVEAACGVSGAGAEFVPARARTEPEAVVALRAVLADADLVHAHGLRAATLAGLARDLLRRRMPLVVSWHRREPAEGAREALLRMLERRVARAATVVLGATTGLVDRARRRGARDARLAPFTPAPALFPAEPADLADSASRSDPADRSDPAQSPDDRLKARAEIGAVDRPLLLSVGPLDVRHGHLALLTAARAWRRLDPPPLLAIAGEGPERAVLQVEIDAQELPVCLLGHRDDALDLLRVADLAVLPASAGTASLLAQEALRVGVPVAGATQDGVRDVVGDAGLLTPPGDADALTAAVTDLLAAPHRLAGLAAAARARSAALPTEESMLAHVLSVYDELLTPPA